jgi:hypothetical protein
LEPSGLSEDASNWHARYWWERGRSMKASFKEIIYGDAYQHHAQVYAKSMITTSSLTVAIKLFFFTSLPFSSALLMLAIFWLVWCVFILTLAISMPCFLVYCLIVSALSGHTEFPSGIPNDKVGWFLFRLKSTWMSVSYIINIAASVLVVSYAFG